MKRTGDGMTKILIVDESQAMRKILSLAFEPYEVLIQYGTGIIDAEQSLTNSDFDIVILDSLQHNGNPSILPRLIKNFAEVKFIVVLGSHEQSSVLEDPGLRHGSSTATLKKPFGTHDVIEVSESLLGFSLKPALKRALNQPGSLQIEHSTTTPLPPKNDRGESLAHSSNEVSRLIEEAVQHYCKTHFRSIAKEVISSELNRLLMERTRRSFE